MSERRARLRGVLVATAVVLMKVHAAGAIGFIETPEDRAIESGVGLISGWHCGGEHIQIRIDQGELMAAGSGMPRGDTASVCGRTDSGWALLFNFNLLDSSIRHEAVAFADGVEFARVRFETRNFGTDYLRGEAGVCQILNFPDLGDQTVIRWSEAKQNFSVVETSADPERPGSLGPLISGDYYGGLTSHDAQRRVRPAIFRIDLTDTTLTVVVEKPLSGSSCVLSGTWRFSGTVVRLDRNSMTSTCSSADTPSFLEVDGKQIYGALIDIGGVLFEGIKIRDPFRARN